MTWLLPWLMSGVTLTAIWAAGDKRPWAWLLSLGNQSLWGLWIYLTWPQAAGLVPMCLALTVLYARNFRKWQRVDATVHSSVKMRSDVNGIPMLAGES